MKPRTFFLIALAIGIIYSVFILIFARTIIWTWFNTFTASFISISFAFTSGLMLYNHQSKTNKEKRIEQLTLMLTAEISDIKMDLATGERFFIVVDGNQLSFILTFIQPLSIEEAIKTGYYEVSITEKMARMARKIRLYNSLVTYTLGLLANSVSTTGTRNFETLVVKASSDLARLREIIIRDVDSLAEEMNISLTNSINF